MTQKNQANHYKKFLLFAIGFFVLILGITFILVWWEDVVALFKGAAGIMFALAGLFALYAINKQK